MYNIFYFELQNVINFPYKQIKKKNNLNKTHIYNRIHKKHMYILCTDMASIVSNSGNENVVKIKINRNGKKSKTKRK